MREQITLDGPAASGKSTLAKKVAETLGAYFINTGDMYRALTWCAQKQNINISDIDSLTKLLNSVNIRYQLKDGKPVLFCEGKEADQTQFRAPEVTENVSKVAAIPEVREWLVARQRESSDLGLLVMEGRDIGTVVFPGAKYKFFVTASPKVRAERRLTQDGEVPEGATVEKVAHDIAKRDEMDMSRAVSPLKQADDAVYIDTSDLTIQQAVDKIVSIIRKKQDPASG